MAFPTSVATDAELHVGVNLLETTLSASIDAVQTTIGLASVAGFPTTGGFFRIGDELIEYTGIAALDATGCTRGLSGTTAAVHLSAAEVRYVDVAEYHNALKDELVAVEQNLSDRLGLYTDKLSLNGPTWDVAPTSLTIKNAAPGYGAAFLSDDWVTGVSGQAIYLSPDASGVGIGAAFSGGLSVSDISFLSTHIFTSKKFRAGDSSVPLEGLESASGINIGAAADSQDGTIQYDGSDFLGRKAGAWVSLASSSVTFDVTTITSNTALSDANDVLLVDATSGPITITLHAVASASQKRYDIKKIDSSGNAVTIDGNGAEQIDGSSTIILATPYDSRTIVPNGSFWSIV